MKREAFYSGLVVSVGLLAAAMPVSAHHSFAVAFDKDKPVTVQAVVTSVKWENPHTLIYADVKDKDGTVEKWTFEGFPPGVLYRKGLRQDRLKPGGEVTLMGFRARDGSNFANLSLAVFPDGKSFCVQFPSGASAGASVQFPGSDAVCGGNDTGQYR
jgi:hypothetical protein